jgi:hypothetical protein
MPHETASIARIPFLLTGQFLRASAAWSSDTFDLPPLLPPEEFGNIIINRN